MKVFTNKKKMRGYREFLYILPFIILVAIFAYYPLYGWAYAFFDTNPPKALSMDDFVGLKWFRYLVDNPVRIKQTLMVLRNHLCNEWIDHFIFLAADDFCRISE